MARPMMMSKEKNVETYVRGLEPGQRALVQTLRRLVKAKAPHLVEVMKWGNVCWVGAGNVCLIHVEADHLDFGFFMGTSLPDPSGILVGNGKFLRMVKIRKPADIQLRPLAESLPARFFSTARAAFRPGRRNRREERACQE